MKTPWCDRLEQLNDTPVHRWNKTWKVRCDACVDSRQLFLAPSPNMRPVVRKSRINHKKPDVCVEVPSICDDLDWTVLKVSLKESPVNIAFYLHLYEPSLVGLNIVQNGTDPI